MSHSVEIGSDAILVAGGSGFIGKALVKRLSDSGQTVVALYHNRFLLPMPNVYPVCSDLCSRQLLAAPLRGVETVVYLAWENSFLSPNSELGLCPGSLDEESNNIIFLKNMIAAMEAAGTKRIVFLSAVGASRESKNGFLKEKYFGEFTVLNSKIKEKLVLRSTIVIDENEQNDRFLASIKSLMRLPWIFPIPRTKEKIAPISVEELTRILQNSISKSIKVGHEEIMEVRGKQEYEVEEFFKMISQKYAGGARVHVGGVLGDALVSLLERQRTCPENPKIRQYLAAGNVGSQD